MQPPQPITEPTRIRPSDVAQRMGPPPWSEALLDDGRNWAVLSGDPPGRRTEAHSHEGYNEWWVVVAGKLRWQIGERSPFHATSGDIVFCPAGVVHSIETLGDGPSLRIAVVPRPASTTAGRPRSTDDEQDGPPNMLHTSVESMLARFGPPMWTEPVILDERNRAGFIHYGPGMSSNPHWHPGLDEWWVALKGELRWRTGTGRPPIDARQGDVVFVPEGLKHGITSVGDETTVRLAVTPTDMPHIYTEGDAEAPPPRS